MVAGRRMLWQANFVPRSHQMNRNLLTMLQKRIKNRTNNNMISGSQSNACPMPPSWDDHIDYIASKSSARIGMLRKVRKVIPIEACITLFDAMILPLYDYCSAVWDNCGKVNKRYLDKLQCCAARVIEGYKSTDQINVGYTFSWLSLQSRRSYNICL